jgi:hypothetical protein
MAVPASAVIEPAALPGTTIIPAGTLDDTSWLKPTMEIYCDDAQSWFCDVRRFSTLADGKNSGR